MRARFHLLPAFAGSLLAFYLSACGSASFHGRNEFRGTVVPIAPAVDVSEGHDRIDRPRPGGSNPDGSDPDRKDPSSPINNPISETLSFHCSDGQDASVASIDYTGEATTRVHAQIEGEFCPRATNQLNIVFVIDFSASMGAHYREHGGSRHPGFDPLQDGSCGRLRAVDAIFRQVQAHTGTGDEINFGIVSYAGDVLANFTTSSLISQQNFASRINANQLCSFVGQSNTVADLSGALFNQSSPSGVVVNPSTNYQAAFTFTNSLLRDQGGRSIVYFISDGEPTMPQDNPVGAAEAAGLQLREQVSNLTVNGLLLGDEPLDSAFSVLDRVTGAQSRVLHANDASELDTKILEFPDPSIDEQSGSGRIEVSPYPEKPLGLMYLRAQSSQVWEFKTQPFVLLGRAGETVANKIIVEAVGSDGSTHSSVITVRYTQP